MIFNSCLFVFTSFPMLLALIKRQTSKLGIILVDICFMLLTTNNFPNMVNTWGKSDICLVDFAGRNNLFCIYQIIVILTLPNGLQIPQN